MLVSTQKCESLVSTHSRPKAAGWLDSRVAPNSEFQHTAARRRLGLIPDVVTWVAVVSTHSRPKAAGKLKPGYLFKSKVSTHSRPKAAGVISRQSTFRRNRVSTHSRPKAAGPVQAKSFPNHQGFNTQPPEGGWFRPHFAHEFAEMFQHTAARRRLGSTCGDIQTGQRFQHTAARRRLGK